MGDLLSVVIGGALAIGGGAFTQWYLQRQKHREESRRLLAVKFEEMVTLIYEYEDWLSVRLDAVLGNVDERGKLDRSSPYPKLYAITAVYFPKLLDAVSIFHYHALEYKHWMDNKRAKLAQNKLDKICGKDCSDVELDGHLEIYQRILNMRSKLMNELTDYASKTWGKEPKLDKSATSRKLERSEQKRAPS